VYSIQEDKLLSEEDKRKSLAEDKKKEMLKFIEDLRNQFMDIKNKNTSSEEFFRLDFTDLNIDPDYHELLQYRVADHLDETNKEVAWDLEYQKTKTEKLKAYY